MNGDTAAAQWGQDEEVLLIEPDRGEDRGTSALRRRRGVGGGEEEGRTLSFSVDSSIMRGREVEEEER